MDDKQLFGLIAALISAAGCLNYIYGIFRHAQRPHAFTWLVWSLIMGIVAYAQFQHGAGAGAWTAAVSGTFCAIIFLLALFRGERTITRGDWVALLSALAIIPFWHFTQNALLAVMLAILIDLCAYFPTVRKVWHRPQEENWPAYAFDPPKWVFGLLAMEDYATINLIYPLFCVIANSGVAVLILTRRRVLGVKPE